MAYNNEIIDIHKYKALLSLSVPYCGGVDLADGTVMHIRTNIQSSPFAMGISYKQVDITIDKIVHTVKKGDTLSSLAAKLNVTVDDFVKANNISNPDLIKVGDVMTLDADMSYIRKFEDYVGMNYFINMDRNAPCVMSEMSKCLGTDGEDKVDWEWITAQTLGWTSAGLAGYQYIPKYNRAVEALSKIPNNTHFVMEWGGELKRYKQKFYGSQNVNKATVAAGKAKYVKRVKVLKGVRFAGKVVGVASLVSSGAQLLRAQNEIEAGDAVLDMLFTAVGFYGPIGAGISVVYFIVDTSLGDGGVYGWLDKVGVTDDLKKMGDNLNQQRELTTSEDGIWWGAHNHFK